MTNHVLTRALLEAGGIDALVARGAPGLQLLTESERAESLRQTLAARPPGEAAWLFGYGSLIWNPTILTVERRTAYIEGWHRAFCLSTQVGRGSLDNPGLVLGLDTGGSCTGVAFRLAEDSLASELALLWRREMLAGSYVPRWVDVLDEQGVRFGTAIAFTINHEADQYEGNLGREAIIQRLATASGELGSAADYLYHTCHGLRAEGIPDPELERLAVSVEAARIANGPDLPSQPKADPEATHATPRGCPPRSA
jgi:glutathione-specific gamma-glutamylcyclotransferase